MPTTLNYPHIEKVEGQPARLERVPRTRVAMLVMDYLAHGYSPDEMCHHYPYLKPAEAHAAMAYYFDHQEEIEAEIEEEIERVRRERGETPPTRLKLRLMAKGLL